MDALIGYSGFVGSHLARAHAFGASFDSRTIGTSRGRAFGLVACAAAPGSMFEANRLPEQDLHRIEGLVAHLAALRADRFVLVSTIAALKGFGPGADERTEQFEDVVPYGRNRRMLEVTCEDLFPTCVVLRLPALFGHGLRKNFLFDLLNPVPSMLGDAGLDEMLRCLPRHTTRIRGLYDHDARLGMWVVDRARLEEDPERVRFERDLEAEGLSALRFTHPETTFQFYALDALWTDVRRATAADLSCLHLAPEPVTAAEVCEAVTGRAMPATDARRHREDMRTLHGALWGRHDGYIVDSGQVIDRLRAFADRARATPRAWGRGA